MRILITGSRGWTNKLPIFGAIEEALRSRHMDPWCESDLTIVHGGAHGVDLIAQNLADEWRWAYEEYPAKDFRDPLARNAHMVSLGADVVLAFAISWGSGTGHCARLARKAGIRTLDYGVVSTRIEDRP